MGAYVESGINGACDAIFVCRSHAVLARYELHGLAVGDHIALETPLMTQYSGEKPITARYRLSVVIVIRTHYPQRSGLTESHAERVEVERTHLARSHMRIGTRHSVASAHRDAVHCEMFGRRYQIIFLQARYHTFTQLPHQIRVLAVSLHATAPARVLRYVEYGRIYIGVPQRRCLPGLHLAYAGDKIFIPCGALSALGREIGGPVVTQTSDALVGEIDRDAQTRLFHEPALNGMLGFDVLGVGERVFGTETTQSVVLFVYVAYAVFPYLPLPALLRQGIFQYAARAVEGGHLAGLLLHRHLREQIPNPILQRSGRILVHIHTAVLVEIYPAFAVYSVT